MTTTHHHDNRNDGRRTARRRQRLAAGLAGATLLFASCGNEASDTAATRTAVRTALVEGTDISPEQADCMVEDAFELHSVDELSTLIGDNPDPAVLQSVTSLMTSCLINTGPGLAGLVGDSDDDDGPVTDGNDDDDGPVTDGNDDDGPVTDGNDDDDGPVTDGNVGDDGDDDVPDPPTVSNATFCASSADALEMIAVGDFFDTGTSGGVVVQWGAEVARLTTLAIADAPNVELAEPPRMFRDSWNNVMGVFPIDGTFADFGADPQIASDMALIGDILGGLEEYLTGPCAMTSDELEGNAEGVAAQFLAQQPETPTTQSGSTISVQDEVSGIWVSVPATWTEQVAEAGPTRSLTIAPSVEMYNTTWAADGAKITAVDVPVGTANWLPGAAAAEATRGCDQRAQEVYDDGAYFGQITAFENCGGGEDNLAIVIGATNTAENVEILVEIQVSSGNEQAFEWILSSFFV